MSTIAVVEIINQTKLEERFCYSQFQIIQNKVTEKLCLKYNKDFNIDTLIIRCSSIYEFGINI